MSLQRFPGLFRFTPGADDRDDYTMTCIRAVRLLPFAVGEFGFPFSLEKPRAGSKLYRSQTGHGLRRLLLLFLQLQRPQVRVHAVLSQELRVRAAFDHAA